MDLNTVWKYLPWCPAGTFHHTKVLEERALLALGPLGGFWLWKEPETIKSPGELGTSRSKQYTEGTRTGIQCDVKCFPSVAAGGWTWCSRGLLPVPGHQPLWDQCFCFLGSWPPRPPRPSSRTRQSQQFTYPKEWTFVFYVRQSTCPGPSIDLDRSSSPPFSDARILDAAPEEKLCVLYDVDERFCAGIHRNTLVGDRAGVRGGIGSSS